MLEIEPTLAYIQATMTENKKKAKKGKRDLYWEDAQSLFLAGKELEEINDLVPVALPTLKRWHQEGQWEEKRRQVPVSPRWLGEALKGVLREKAGRIIVSGDLKTQELDELTKIVTLIDRLCSQGWDMRAAALEVMDKFSDFLRGWVTDQEELKRISFRVQEFFQQLEDEL
ncbi:MAG: hypothetical protein ACOZFS_08300 [Thermodesulfobacteriota bacterium]